MSFGNTPYVLPEEGGEAIWFLGLLATIKATGEQTQNAYGLQEHVLAPGREPPPHIHHAQDEAFYILEGTAMIMCGDRTWRVSAGSFVFLPKGIVHGFKIEGEALLKMLVITSPGGTAEFESFVQEMGEPAQERVLPPAAPPDLEKLLTLSKKYDIELMIPAPVQEGR